jgi:hypothetical protein
MSCILIAAETGTQTYASGFTLAELVALLISSSVLAALISIAGNQFLAQLQFKRDYYKEIIAKRLNAYQQIDELIGILRMTTYDDKGRIAHALFVNKHFYDRATMLSATAIALSLYLSEQICDSVSKINFSLLKLPGNATESQAFEIGVTQRKQISELRRKLEHQVGWDLLELHRVKRFLKAKRQHISKSKPFLAWLPRHGGFSFGSREDKAVD